MYQEYGIQKQVYIIILKRSEDIMLIQDAYIVMYNILNNYYWHENKNDALGSLLSDMDPYIFSDRKAADPATYNDWCNVINNYAKNGEIEKENITLALREFLIYYEQEFDYHLEDVIKYVCDVTIKF